MLPLWARVDLGAMAMKGYSALPKAPAILEPYHQIVYCHIQDTHCGGSYPSAEMQPVYSTAPANWASPYQVLPLWARVDLGAIAMKGYSAFPKAFAILEPSLLSYKGHSLAAGLTVDLFYSPPPPRLIQKHALSVRNRLDHGNQMILEFSFALHWGESGELRFESIRRARPVTFQKYWKTFDSL